MRQSICERIKTHSSLAGNQLLIVRYGRGRGGEGETRETWPETENTQHVPRPNSLSLKVLLVAQSSWETTFCCSPSQKLLPETLGYGKRVWNCGTWSVIEAYPNENLGLRTAQSNHPHVSKDLIQDIASTQNSSRTYMSISARHQLRYPSWCLTKDTRSWWQSWIHSSFWMNEWIKWLN